MHYGIFEYLNNGGGGNKTSPRCRFPAHSVRSARRHIRFSPSGKVAMRHARPGNPSASRRLARHCPPVWQTRYDTRRLPPNLPDRPYRRFPCICR